MRLTKLIGLVISGICFSCVSCSLLFGVAGKDSVVLSCTSTFAPNGVTMTDSYDWIKQIGQCYVGFFGPFVYCDIICDMVAKENSLYELNYNGKSMSPHVIAGLIRNELTLNKEAAHVLVAGWDHVEDEPVLYWLDELGAIKKVTYAAHGHEYPFLFSVLDRQNNQLYHQEKQVGLESLDVEGVLDVVDLAWKTVQQRSKEMLTNRQTMIIHQGKIWKKRFLAQTKAQKEEEEG